MSTDRELTTTSYAILGLLAIQPWSAYELARQMRRNLHYFWPRAESNVYAEPKRLVAGGFARSRTEAIGRRPRTVYAITARGRRALARWLEEPAAASRFESETLVKMMFAPYASKDALVAHLRRYRDELEATQDELRSIFSEYAAGEDPFPERAHVNAACYRLIWDTTRAASQWAEWAIEVVEQWPDVAKPHDRAALVQVLAERSALEPGARRR